MTGREKEVTGGTSTINTWKYSGATGSGYFADSRFVYLDHKDDYLADATHLKTDYFYDCPNVTPCYGLLTKVQNEGDLSSTNDDTWVTTPYNIDTTKWIFTPQYELVTDVDPASVTPAPTTLRRKNFTYDVLGRLTQSATLLDATLNTFSTVTIGYDGYGNVSSETGDVPGGNHYMTFDPLFHTFPASVTNALNQTTTYTGDPISAALNGSTDVTVTAPKAVGGGHVTHTKYDTFGRPTKMWDDAFGDDVTFPTKTYTYTWGVTGQTNETRVNDRITSGQAPVRSAVTCMDGFGREIERRDQYSGTTFNSVRTDYNARGLKAAQTTAVANGVVATCPASPAAVFGRDRTLYAYDVRNNPTTTIFAQAGVWPSCGDPEPCTQVSTLGLTTTAIDENRHKTIRVRNLGARTETVQEYTGTGLTADLYALYATTTYTHDLMGSLTNVKDAANNLTTLGYDVAGRKTSMADPDMGSWTYGYDTTGNLTSQTDARGIKTTLTYDALSRLWTKSFNDTPQTPGVTYTYDVYPVGAPCTQGAATAIGKLVQMTDGAGIEQHCYDLRGREVTTHRTIDGAGYDVLKTYDSANRLQDLRYPDGEVVHHAYDSGGGWLNSLCQWTGAPGAAGTCAAGNTYLSGATTKAWMAPESMTLGVGQTTSYSYDYRLRLKTIQTGISAASQNLTLTYDDASNVTCVGDNNDCAPASTSGEKVAYTYDALNRLKTGSGFTGGLTAAYSYDQIGNLISKQEGATTLTLPPNPSGLNMPQPHAVQQIVLPKSRWFTYDANGNQVGSGNDQYDFDAENRIMAIHGAKPATPPKAGSACVDMDNDGVISILDLSRMAASFGKVRGQTGYDFRADIDWDNSNSILDYSREAASFNLPCPGQQTRYLYDGNGALLKRTNIDTSTSPATSTWTIYAGGIFEKNFSSATGATGTTDYYAAYGRAIAVRQTPGTGTMTLSYLLADQLGSTVGAIDAVTGAVSAQQYWPYGGSRSGAVAQTDKAYTGQQREQTTTAQTPFQDATDALGLYFYHARFYSTTMGRFVSADTVADGLNRYAYVRNNPMRYTDPTGRCVGGLHCDPVVASSVAACARSISTCATVLRARHLAYSPADVKAAYEFAHAAAQNYDFWRNYFRKEYYPLLHLPELQAAYQSQSPVITSEEIFHTVVAEGLRTIDSIFARDPLGDALEGLKQVGIDIVTGNCTSLDCLRPALSALGVGVAIAGLVTEDPLLTTAGAILYATDVQITWIEFQRGDASWRDLWVSVLSGALAFGPHGSDAAVAVLDYIKATVCDSTPDRC